MTTDKPTRAAMEREINEWLGRADLGLHERARRLMEALAALGCCQPEPRAVGWWVGKFPGITDDYSRWWNGRRFISRNTADGDAAGADDFLPRALLVEKPR